MNKVFFNYLQNRNFLFFSVRDHHHVHVLCDHVHHHVCHVLYDCRVRVHDYHVRAYRGHDHVRHLASVEYPLSKVHGF